MSGRTIQTENRSKVGKPKGEHLKSGQFYKVQSDRALHVSKFMALCGGNLGGSYVADWQRTEP